MISSLMLIFALCMDSFLVSLAYGVKNIHIPMPSIWIITGIETAMLGISFYGASQICAIINPNFCRYLSTLIFLLIGLGAIFQNAMKQFIKNHKRKIKISVHEILIVLDIIVDETKADFDHSKELSMKEASYLAFALSLDSFISGFAYGMQTMKIGIVLLLNLGIGFLAIYAGFYLGHFYQKINQEKFTWVSGILFLVIAIMKFFKL